MPDIQSFKKEAVPKCKDKLFIWNIHFLNRVLYRNVLNPLVPVNCVITSLLLWHHKYFAVESWSSGSNWGLKWWSLVFRLYLLSPWSSSTHATIFPSQPGTTAPSWNTYTAKTQHLHIQETLNKVQKVRLEIQNDYSFFIEFSGMETCPPAVFSSVAQARLLLAYHALLLVFHICVVKLV